MITDAKTKLHFLTKYTSLGASSRYRTLQYLPYLQEDQFEIKVSPLFNDDYLKALYSSGRKPVFQAMTSYLKRFGEMLWQSNSAHVILENELWPYLPFFIEQGFLKKQKKLTLIYDDAIFHHYDLSKNAYLQLNKNKIGELMKLADNVIVGNQYLADYVLDWNSNVQIIPTVIDERLYAQIKNYNKTTGKLKVVWIGSPATASYLYELEEVWNEPWIQENIELTVIGAKSLKINGNVNYLEWSETREVEEMQKCDLGIMPLPDSPWARGKCGFKLIQYMAAGLPCLASPVGVNTEIIQEGQTGFLPDTAEKWLECFKLFYKQPELIEVFGKAGRERAFEKYSIKATLDDWKRGIL